MSAPIIDEIKIKCSRENISKMAARHRRCVWPVLAISLLVLIVYMFTMLPGSGTAKSYNMPDYSDHPLSDSRNYKPLKIQDIFEHQWVPYKFKEFRNKSWLESQCLHERSVSKLEKLPSMLARWKYTENEECRQLHRVFTSILTVTYQSAKIVVPRLFEPKVSKWLGNNKDLMTEARDQSVIFVFNEYTKEQNSYNPIRSKRPMAVPEQPEREYIDELSKKTSQSCDFCNYRNSTAEDVFGRIDNQYSYSASNTFKLDKWHGLFMMKTHHPLSWSKKQYLDLMKTSQQWFSKAYNYDKTYHYPSTIWDLLPHAGASQVHPHMHGFLDVTHYQGAFENWKVAATEFAQDFPTHNYFADLIEVHSVLGLTVTHGNVVAFANLVSKKENEIVVISEKPDQDFYDLLYVVYRAYLDQMQQLCYSSAVAFPNMADSTGPDSLPVVARLVTRGAVADIRSDVSSLELFTATNANTDPYRVIKDLKAYIKKSRRR